MSACELLRAKLRKYVAEQAGASPWYERGGQVARVAWLTSLKTPEKILVSHVVTSGAHDLLVQPLATVIDYMGALVKHATTDRETPVEELRGMHLPNRQTVRALAAGAKEGATIGAQVLKERLDPDRVNQDILYEQVNFKHPAFQKAVDQVFAVHGSEYKPFYYSALRRSLADQAYTLATREGLRGDARMSRALQLADGPSDEMLLRAQQDAAERTFQNPTVVSEGLNAVRNALRRNARGEGRVGKLRAEGPSAAASSLQLGAQVGYLGFNLTMPFTHIPPALFGAGLRYTPLGAAIDIAAALGHGAPEGTIPTALSRMAIGTGGLFALGYVGAKMGKVTGAWPTTPAEAAQWQTEGKDEYAIRVGKTWRGIKWLGPVAFPFMVGANVAQDAMKSEAQSPVATALGTAGQLFADEPYMTSAQNAIEALSEPSRGVTKAITGFVPIPPPVSQVAQVIDPTQRQATGIVQQFEGKIPFLSRRLAPRVGIFNEPLQRYASRTGPLWDVSRGQPARTNPVLQELDRLRVFIGRPSPVLRGKGETYTRTPAQMDSLMTTLGPAEQRAATSIMADPGYARATDEQRAYAIKKAVAAIRHAANERELAKYARAGVLTRTARGGR